MKALNAILPLAIPTLFAVGLDLHFSRPYLPASWGCLPWREAIVVQYVIWSMYCLAAAGIRRGRTQVACRLCGEPLTMDEWDQHRRCPACGHNHFRLLASGQDFTAPRVTRRRGPRVQAPPPPRLTEASQQRVRQRLVGLYGDREAA